MMDTLKKTYRWLIPLSVGWCFSTVLHALNLSNVPLFLQQGAAPNVLLALDDSGSMDWTITGREHWNYCAYDNSINGNCGRNLRRGDSFQLPYINQTFSGGQWSDDVGTVEDRWPYYIFSAQNNLYGNNNCSRTVQSCFSGNDEAPFVNGDTRRIAHKEWRYMTSSTNVTYYNPASSYTPWKGMSDADFHAAKINPVVNTTVDLGTMISPDGRETGFIYHVWHDTHGFPGGSTPNRINRTTGANNMVDLWDEHERYVVTASSIRKNRITYSSNAGALTRIVGPDVFITDANPDVVMDANGNEVRRTPGEIRQNIANWYQYNRRRMFVVKGAVGNLMDEFGHFRYGVRSINNTFNYPSRDLPAAAVTDYTNHNNTLRTDLYSWPQPARGTPLRRGLARAGDYLRFGAFDTNGDRIGNQDVIISSCQQNFTILFTDGYYNGSAAGLGDVDGDGRSDTLADVARFFALADLSGLANNSPNLVPVPEEPASADPGRQRMVTFTAAFGLKGDLSSTDNGDWPNYNARANGGAGGEFIPKVNESWTFTGNAGKIDDMWHAAYNSAGQHISAASPEDLIDGLKAVFSEISRRAASLTTVASSSGQFNTDTYLYTATFDSDNWTGDLKAFKIASSSLTTGLSVATTPDWSAAEILNKRNLQSSPRQILTYNGKQGIAFRFPGSYPVNTASEQDNEMTREQMQMLSPGLLVGGNEAADIQQGQNLVSWIRGDNTAGNYRKRDSRLGDIINSSAVYITAPNSLYPKTLEPGASQSYAEFARANKHRQKMLYIGANDGMLHAFNADTGTEVFAYVPSMLYKKLPGFAQTNVNHSYFVDATPAVADVYIAGKGWRTVLVGGLGAGGQGIFALDVTDPALVEANAKDKVLWEFSDKNDVNLGFTFSEPQIVRLANGQWAAIFASGYDAIEADGRASTTGRAHIYIVNIADGSVIKNIEIPAGSLSQENGVATVSIADVNGDYIADYIYAGDLLGNLWRVDIDSADSNDWQVAFGGNALFKTQVDQPITVQPVLGANISSSGVLIYFGTGKYLEPQDASPIGAKTQSFYAVLDELRSNATNNYPLTKDNLLQQEIIEEKALSGKQLGNIVRTSTKRAVNWATQKGWYMDLQVRGESNQGELIANNYRAIVLGSRILFKSIVPDANECSSGGSSWTYELNAYSGARLATSPIDTNNDGKVDASDNVQNGASSLAGSGFKGQLGALPNVMSHKSKMEIKVSGTVSGSFELLTESSSSVQGRRSWRQLK